MGLGAGIVDVDVGLDQAEATDYFRAFQLAQACRVAEQDGGVVDGRSAAGEGGTHAADALFVDGNSVAQAVSGNRADGQRERGLQPEFFH